MSALDFLPSRSDDLTALVKAARGCEGCDLWENATQTVFGEGHPGAQLMLVGEQPGDEEDRTGHPFVGPAGRLLDRALTQAGIERRDVYVTNAVKHFKWEARGKRRIHKPPSKYEIGACRPWLESELLAVRPRLLVAMGATAAGALLGPGVKVTRDRGTILETAEHRLVAVTVHPSAILRSRDAETRHEAFSAFVADLKVVAAAINRDVAQTRA